MAKILNKHAKPSIQIELTWDEAQFLYAVTRQVDGDPHFSRRGYADSIREALEGVPNLTWFTGDISQSMVVDKQ